MLHTNTSTAATPTTTPTPILAVDGMWGWYAPQHFCENWRPALSACGLAEEGQMVEDLSDDIANASEPRSPEEMWEVWEEILDNFYTTIDGVEYTLFEADGGDLFLVPDGFDTEEDW